MQQERVKAIYHTESKTDKDGNARTENLCNFYIEISRILELGDDIRLASGTIYYTQKVDNMLTILSKSEDVKEIHFSDLPLHTFHDKKLFMAWVCKFPELHYKQESVPYLLSSIVKDYSFNLINTTRSKKIMDWGWNEDFTAYRTDIYDFELEMEDDGYGKIPFIKNGKYVLVNQYRDIQSEYDIIEGSVKFYDEDWGNKIHISFSEKGMDTYKETMRHIKDELLLMHPTMPRIISHTFLAPMTSIIRKMGYYYIMFLRGTTGFGKTRIEALMASFFGNYSTDNDFISALADSRPAIEAIGFYSKDCLFVIDNYKETSLDKYKIDGMINILQNAADGHARTTKISKGHYLRGGLLISGEEMVQDASTIRKADIVILDSSIDMEIKDRCYLMKENYPAVMVQYIKYLLTNYGNTLLEFIKKEMERKDIEDPYLKLNAIGYKLFLGFFRDEGIIAENECVQMFSNHLETLKSIDEVKKNNTQSRTTGELFMQAIRTGVMTKQFAIAGDIEFAVAYKPVIGQISNEGKDISIYDEAYSIIRRLDKEYFNLPIDKASVYNCLRDLAKEKPVWNKDRKKSTRLLTFDREILLPNSGNKMIDKTAVVGAIVSAISSLKVNTTPDKMKHAEIMIEVRKLCCPSNKKSDIEMFQDSIKEIVMAFYMGKGWEYPS